MKRVNRFLSKLTFFTLTFLFTLYVGVNAYEIVSKQDVPFAHAVSPLNINSQIDRTIEQFDTKIDSRYLNNNAKLGDLNYLEFPQLETRLYLEEGRNINDEWYIRPTIGGYVGLNTNDIGYFVDYVIFTKKSWRSIPFTDELEDGMTMNLYSMDGRRTSFVVLEKKVKEIDEQVVISKSDLRQIIIFIEDESIGKYYVLSLQALR